MKLHLDRMQLPPAFVVAALVFIVAGGISAVGRYTSLPAVALQPTPALPVIIFATAAPQPPTAAPAAHVAAVLPRFVVCYDQPVNGSVLGPIPAPDTSAIVARYGADWVMTPWNGGYCWLRAAEVGMPDVADLQPAPAPHVVYVASEPEAVPTPTEAIYQTAAEIAPAPTAAPVVRAEDFKAPDPKAACAFVGCLH